MYLFAATYLTTRLDSGAITAVMTTVFVTVMLLTTLVSLTLVTIAVNVLVMMCVVTQTKLHTTLGMYTFSLAVADGLVGLGVMPGMNVYTIYGLWPLGQVLCTLWVCTDFVCCTVSMLHVLLFAHDRFRAICRPISYRNTCGKWNYAMTYIALAWVAGMSAWLPSVLYYRSVLPTIENDCFFIPPRLYVLLQSVAVYYTPLLLIVVIYVICVDRLRKRFRKIADMHQLEIAATTVVNSSESIFVVKANSAIDGQNSDTTLALAHERQRQRRRRHIRSLRMLGAIIALFMLCWLPFCLFWPISAYFTDAISANVYQYSYWSAYLNSTINPLLYFAFQGDFRQAFLALRTRLYCSC